MLCTIYNYARPKSENNGIHAKTHLQAMYALRAQHRLYRCKCVINYTSNSLRSHSFMCDFRETHITVRRCCIAANK